MKITVVVLIFFMSLIGCSTAPKTTGIDKEGVRRGIRDNRKIFMACYDQSLKRNKNSYGKIELQWDIDENGTASAASVKSNTTGDEKFGQCMTEAIAKIKFVLPPKGQVARIVFPFVFKANAEPDSGQPTETK